MSGRWGVRLPDGTIWQHSELFRDAASAAQEVLFYRENVQGRGVAIGSKIPDLEPDYPRIAAALGYTPVRVMLVEVEEAPGSVALVVDPGQTVLRRPT